MQAQPAILQFSEGERPTGERLLKIAIEIDRVEGYSEPHSIVIARLSETIGIQMGLHGTDLTALKFAALAHDIGERVMKRNYLLRPDGLTWEETLDLWRHPILGEQAAGELRLSRQTQLLIRWHHEWWNGLGYPDGLSGEAIPLGARILRLVDSYYALISDRPYRQRFEKLEAEQIIADLAGIEFDPRIVKLMLSILADERRERETGLFNVAPGSRTQIILTPEGLQTAFVASELLSESEELETFSEAEEPVSQFDELTADGLDEFPPLIEQEAPQTPDYELLTVENVTTETRDASAEPPATSEHSDEISAENDHTEIETLEPESSGDEGHPKQKEN
jgi:hypothetical protein